MASNNLTHNMADNTKTETEHLPLDVMNLPDIPMIKDHEHNDRNNNRLT
jgi:hypothetical protein